MFYLCQLVSPENMYPFAALCVTCLDLQIGNVPKSLAPIYTFSIYQYIMHFETKSICLILIPASVTGCRMSHSELPIMCRWYQNVYWLNGFLPHQSISPSVIWKHSVFISISVSLLLLMALWCKCAIIKFSKVGSYVFMLWWLAPTICTFIIYKNIHD